MHKEHIRTKDILSMCICPYVPAPAPYALLLCPLYVRHVFSDKLTTITTEFINFELLLHFLLKIFAQIEKET